MTEFAAIRLNSYSYIRDNNDENKRVKDTEKSVIRRKIKFEDYENCLEANQLEKEIKHLEKNKFYTDDLKENNKEFIRKN